MNSILYQAQTKCKLNQSVRQIQLQQQWHAAATNLSI